MEGAATAARSVPPPANGRALDVLRSVFGYDAFREQHAQYFPGTAAGRQRLEARHEKGSTDDAPLAHG